MWREETFSYNICVLPGNDMAKNNNPAYSGVITKAHQYILRHSV